MLLHFLIFFYRTYALQKWKEKEGRTVKYEIISPDTLEKRRHYGMTGSKQTGILSYVRV